MEDWQNSTKCLEKRAQYVLSKALFCDCEFIIGKKKIRCHKLLLAMGSPVFQAMFYGSNPEPSGPIEIKDINTNIFTEIIEYIYGKQINISTCKNACDLYYAAKKYLMYFLERDCIDYLMANLSKDNVLYLYEFAQFHNEEELLKQCIVEIQMKTGDVFGEKNVFEITEDTLSSILDLNIMNVPSELYLFKAVENWVTSTKSDIPWEAQRDICLKLMKKVRLLTLSIEEFTEGPANSKYLSDGEKLAILLRITKALRTPMNNGLCELTTKRKQANFKRMSVLNLTDLKNARCDGSEWLTSVFKTNSSIDLLGVEIRLQVYEEDDEYIENLMVKVGKANSEEHFAEGALCGTVQYNSKAQVMLNTVSTLEPHQEYAIHVFLCRPGMYPIGKHTSLSCQNESVIIDFVSHSSWERAHPFNTTVISSLIYSDNVDD